MGKLLPKGHDSRKISKPITKSDYEGRLVIQEHKADKAGLHYDFRFHLDKSGKTFSFAGRRYKIQPGERRLLVAQPDHTSIYSDFQGVISDGYGKGQVRKIFDEKINVLESDINKIIYEVYKGQKVDRYNLVNTNGKNWLLMNVSKSHSQIPSNKKKYKEIPFNEVNLDKDDQSIAPKFSGALGILLLDKNKRPELYSYRYSKKNPTHAINHTPKSHLHKLKTPKGIKDTILRGEIVAELKNKIQDESVTSGYLNSNSWKAKASKLNANFKIFDIDKYMGKDVSKLPYAEKIKILADLKNKFSDLDIIRVANTPNEKRKLINKIKDKNGEGIVIYDHNSHTPIKSKNFKDKELKLIGTYPGTGRLKNSIGGLLLDNNGTVIRVGSGLTDEQRLNIKNNFKKNKNKLFKVKYLKEFPSGKLEKPTIISKRELW